jgi:hypothetical protein
MTLPKKLPIGAALLVAATAAAVLPAAAKKARCFTTDDGYFQCSFTAIDKRGSFRIEARGYPAYTLEIDQPGFAWGFVEIGGRTISLPGQYVRGSDDPACWSNPETNTKICAW